MKYTLEKTTSGLKVRISDLKGRMGQFLKAFEQCRDGQCSCHTDEYRKLADLQIEQKDDGIELQLTASAGNHFDPAEIDRCLQHTTMESCEKSSKD